MPGAVLVDSSFFIQRLRDRIDPLLELSTYADTWDLATCGMVKLEVCRGLRVPVMRSRYAARFAEMIYAPTNQITWERAAILAYELDKGGNTIPAPDLVIAACAMAIDAPILTFDRHFQLVPGLQVLDRLN
jgi:predicted nucleic acid-binding protein